MITCPHCKADVEHECQTITWYPGNPCIHCGNTDQSKFIRRKMQGFYEEWGCLVCTKWFEPKMKLNGYPTIGKPHPGDR